MAAHKDIHFEHTLVHNIGSEAVSADHEVVEEILVPPDIPIFDLNTLKNAHASLFTYLFYPLLAIPGLVYAIISAMTSLALNSMRTTPRADYEPGVMDLPPSEPERRSSTRSRRRSSTKRERRKGPAPQDEQKRGLKDEQKKEEERDLQVIEQANKWPTPDRPRRSASDVATFIFRSASGKFKRRANRSSNTEERSKYVTTPLTYKISRRKPRRGSPSCCTVEEEST